MPDYDSKSIPVLNDVIVDDEITDEQEIVDLSDLNASSDDDNFDLFIDDTEATPLENLSVGTINTKSITAEIGDNVKINFEKDIPPSVNLPEDEPEIESALIDYGIKEGIPLVESIEAEAPLVTTLEKPEVKTIKSHANTPAMPVISLETLTEDIVKQIMPAMEEQLRHLVQQALAEKLPEALVTSSSRGDNQNNDHKQ